LVLQVLNELRGSFLIYSLSPPQFFDQVSETRILNVPNRRTLEAARMDMALGDHPQIMVATVALDRRHQESQAIERSLEYVAEMGSREEQLARQVRQLVEFAGSRQDGLNGCHLDARIHATHVMKPIEMRTR
jgi:hypothetical protein